jgi:ribosomal protein S17E
MYDIHYNADGTFIDVPVYHWARPAIDTAYRNGLMIGYGDNTFGPDNELTYTQTARVILNALGYGDLAWPYGVNTVAYELGLYDNVKTGDFNTGCSRAHAAQMIYNAFNLEIVNEYAGQHFGTNKTFLNDILGYEETTKYEDGHIYVAFKNLNDKKADLLVTDVRSTIEKVIYPSGNNGYKFTTSKREKVSTFKWADVDLFVNGVDVTDVNWFVNADEAIGVFNNEDELIAIYVEYNGDTWVPATGFAGAEMNAELYEEVTTDKDFNWNTSTVTYFIEDGTYEISNEIICGFITDVTKSAVWVDDVKYVIDHEYNNTDVDKFIVIFVDVNGELVDDKIIPEPYRFNIETKKYHTWECHHYNDRANDTNWKTSNADVKAYITEKGLTDMTFTACKDCHADGKITIFN